MALTVQDVMADWKLQDRFFKERYGVRNVGLNADWSVSAYHLGRGKANVDPGEPYILDNEDGSYSFVRRWYVEGGPAPYAGMPDKYHREYADGYNDAIVELKEFDSLEETVGWLDKNVPTGRMRAGAERVAWWHLRDAKEHKPGDFVEGDIVRYTGKFLRSTGMLAGAPINGKVVKVKSGGGFASGWPYVEWSDRDWGAEPMLVNPINIEFDPRFRRRGGEETGRTARKQKLMTSELRRKLPPLYSQEDEKDPIVYAKFFNPYGSGTWLITEFDGRDTMFGYVMGLGGDEWGYISLRELESMERFPGVQQIERDAWFKPMPFSKAKHQ